MASTISAFAIWTAVSIVTTGLLVLLICRSKRNQQEDLRNPHIWHTEPQEAHHRLRRLDDRLTRPQAEETGLSAEQSPTSHSSYAAIDKPSDVDDNP
ncbi:hypothetical protein ACFYO7_29400 [Nocardia salmonicida]|uniref:hypothetical protein n=1 Tax=Nocardia salmonicida TaxID=53431 RepID=UPI00369901BE